MSENNPGVNVQQSDNRSSEQNKDNKNRKPDAARQDTGRAGSRNRNHRRRNNGGRQGGYDNKKHGGQEPQAEGKPRERNNRDRQGGREQNNKPRREQNQGNEKKQFSQTQNPKQRKPRTREIDEVVAKNVKKVETIDDIRSDNARITKEIYLEIASLKNINLN